jgi:DNA-binding NtrC family response regulator
VHQSVLIASARVSHIFVIDDDNDICFILQEVLRAEGYKVSMAADGAQGIELQRNRPTSLLISDVFMPNKGGIEIIRDFLKEFPSVPIIAISGGGRLQSPSRLSTAKELGASVIRRKPFEMGDLLKSVASAPNGLET